MKQNNEIRVGDRVRFKPWAEVVKMKLIKQKIGCLEEAFFELYKVYDLCDTEATVEGIFYNLDKSKSFMLKDFSSNAYKANKAEFPAEFLEKVEMSDETE